LLDSDVCTLVWELITGVPGDSFFSSMKSKKELGKIIEIANREPNFEKKAEKFLSLIRN
jgi:hypothetical protein